MTEAQWLACADPTPMLHFVRGRASGRKLRLFAVACCRRIWDQLPGEASHRAVEFTERFADGHATVEELATAFAALSEQVPQQFIPGRPYPAQVVWHAGRAALFSSWPPPRHMDARSAARHVASTASHQAARAVEPNWAACKAERVAQAQLLRDLFGNPFRTVRPGRVLSPWFTWCNATVVHLAQAIYDEAAFDRMPILADALEEAGCTHHDILNHCRGPGPHARGCFVVDLLLGKK
jgi:hypothetical protein